MVILWLVSFLVSLFFGHGFMGFFYEIGWTGIDLCIFVVHNIVSYFKRTRAISTGCAMDSDSNLANVAIGFAL